MRIDDRKVNGRITIEPGDIIKPWMILIDLQGGQWIDGVDENRRIRKIPDSMAGAAISAAANAFAPLSLMVLVMGPDPMVLPFPLYSFNQIANVLTIDIDKLMPNKTLEIALPSGSITVKDST